MMNAIEARTEDQPRPYRLVAEPRRERPRQVRHLHSGRHGAALRVHGLGRGVGADGGDAETGSGLEVGGSLRWTSGNLTIEVAARGLMAHSEDDYEEWGVSGSVQYAQAPGAGSTHPSPGAGLRAGGISNLQLKIS